MCLDTTIMYYSTVVVFMSYIAQPPEHRQRYRDNSLATIKKQSDTLETNLLTVA